MKLRARPKIPGRGKIQGAIRPYKLDGRDRRKTNSVTTQNQTIMQMKPIALPAAISFSLGRKLSGRSGPRLTASNKPQVIHENHVKPRFHTFEVAKPQLQRQAIIV